MQPIVGPSRMLRDHSKPTVTGKRVVHHPSPLFDSTNAKPQQEAISDTSTIGTCAAWHSRGDMCCTSCTTTLQCNDVPERLVVADQHQAHNTSTSKFRSNSKTRRVWNQIKSCTFQQIKLEYTSDRIFSEDLSDVRIHCDELLSLNQMVGYDGVNSSTPGVKANDGTGNLHYVENRSGLYNCKEKWNSRNKKECNRKIETTNEEWEDMVPQVDYIGQHDSMSSVTVQEPEQLQELSCTPWETTKEGCSVAPSPQHHHHSTTRSNNDPVSIIRSDSEVPMKRDAKNQKQKHISALRDDVLLIYGIDITKQR